ncbi:MULTISPECIES: hypothetical protein [unclassified Streptomyces]|uniref:hypothetical protein n=1 Tax=unclassified Streptomyces TaxID=2593676 RepID=UPI001929A884|nr:MULTISPECIES: hypothetical protein [unclassified Streptomyces]CAD5956566.1 conserved protein of unknown function [Streptomyces sp. KY75]CAD5981904.1 conserved protein of unknown function [Streptomyces sp. KY70]
MTELDRLTALFRALGADDDAPDWAESEAEEGLPQLARYRFLRTVWQDVDAWSTEAPRWVAAYRSDGVAAGAVDRALAAGLTPEDLGELARETAFGVLYALADPADGSLPAEIEAQLPGWRLAELDPAGEPTGRHLDALHEDFASLEPKGIVP